MNRDLHIKIALKAQEEPKEFSLKRFEKLFEINYFQELLFENWKIEQWVRKKCESAHKKGKIGQLALWLGKFHGKEIALGKIPEVSIRWIDEKIGYGLFAENPFKKWDYIGEYTGILRKKNLIFPNINDYCFMYPRSWLPLKVFTIDSQNQGNYTRFINHSDTPNCESVSVFYEGVFHIIFRAIQDIPAGDQLTYDYGGIYWKNRKKLKEEENIEDLVPLEAIPKSFTRSPHHSREVKKNCIRSEGVVK